MYLPSTVKYIGKLAFAGCHALTSINLPEGVEEIDFHAFDGAGDSIKQLVLPRSMKRLGAGSFMHMPGLTRVYCPVQEPPVCNKDITSEMPFQDNNTTHSVALYVPKGTLAKYTSTWGWSTFTYIYELDDGDFPMSGLNEVNATSSSASRAIYDLMGRRVEHPQPGQVYIVGGKKVLYTR